MFEVKCLKKKERRGKQLGLVPFTRVIRILLLEGTAQLILRNSTTKGIQADGLVPSPLLSFACSSSVRISHSSDPHLTDNAQSE